MVDKLLKEMIADEKKAPIQYNRLLKHFKNKEDKRVIRGIIKQERQHKKKLLRIARR